MHRVLRLRRGNSTVTSTFVGKAGEVTIDNTKHVLVVHDGVTPGGWPQVGEGSLILPIASATVLGGIKIGSGLNIDGNGVVTVNTASIGNLSIDNQTINGTVVNGNIGIAPNGTGRVILSGLAFPNTDGNNGQTLLTDGNGNLYWSTPSSVTFSTTAPSSPHNGDIWVDSSTGIEYIYYTDVDGGQWVEFGPTNTQNNNINFTALSSSIIPSANSFYNLGDSSHVWNNVFVGNSISLNGTSLSISNGNLVINGNVFSANPFDQSLNTTDSVLFSSVGVTNAFVAQLNGANPGGAFVLQTAGTYNWFYNANGSLTWPDGTTQSTAWDHRPAYIGNVAPSYGQGSIWWHNEEGRAYVKYGNIWTDLSPTVVPPHSTYLGNLDIDDRTIYNTDTLAADPIVIQNGDYSWQFNGNGKLTINSVSSVSGFFVEPVRNAAATGNAVYYNTSTKEFTYTSVSNASASLLSVRNELSNAISAVNNALSVETQNRIAQDNILSTVISEFQHDLASAYDIFSATISAEIHNRISADDYLSNIISDEIHNRISADDLLSNALSAEIYERTSADSQLSIRIDDLTSATQVISTQLASVDDKLSNAISVVNADLVSVRDYLSNAISGILAGGGVSVTSAAIYAEISNLQSAINAVSSGTGGTVSVTSAELASIDTKLSDAISVVASQVATNSAQMTSADSSLGNAISVVSHTLVSIDNKLSNALSDLTHELLSIDGKLSNALSSTNHELLSLDNKLSNALSAEIADRHSVSAVLETHINAVSNLVSVVSVAAANATSIANAASVVAANATSIANAASNAVSVEIANRISADNVLSNAISVVSVAVANATSIANAASNAVSVEVANRQSASAALETHINNVSNAISVVSAAVAANSAQMTSADNAISNAVSVVSAAQLSTWNRVSAILTSATTFSGSLYTFSGNITANTSGFPVGYRDIPQVSFNANATLALTDAGKHYYSTSASTLTLTIPNNTSISFAVGTAVNLVNFGTGNVSVLQGSGVTLYLAGNSTSGNRTVTSYGAATMLKVATDTWMINGVNVS